MMDDKKGKGQQDEPSREKRARDIAFGSAENGNETDETMEDAHREYKPKAVPSNTRARKEDSQPSGGGTYPKPKNFAERLMNVLENDVVSDIIWWYGDEDYVAINTNQIKNSSVLNTHFQGIRYAAFVRNLSRWGFRKIPNMSTPEGATVYRNSLFQRDKPHLARHMKIDSDVQDIFGQHQNQRSSPVAEQKTDDSISNDQLAMVQPRLDASSLAMLSGLLTQQGQSSNLASIAAQVSVSSSANTDNISLMAQAPEVVPSDQQASDEILREILQLSRQYLELAPPSPSPTSSAIRSLLVLLIELGTKRMQMHEQAMLAQRRQQGQQRNQQQQSSNLPLLQNLLLSLGQNQLPQQQQQPAMGNALALGFQNHQQQQQQPSMGGPMQSWQQQQQQQPTAHPGLSSRQAEIQNLLLQVSGSGIAGAANNTSLQLLQQLSQQQPNGQSSNE